MPAEITNCTECPLRALPAFKSFDAAELAFVTALKSGEMTVEARATVLEQGVNSAHVFTVLSGWAMREKTLEDGRRQVLGFVMPGDLIGLQAMLFNEMEHSVVALGPLTLCVFQRPDILRLFRDQPSLGYTVVWHAARSERMLDEALTSVGRRSAAERIGHALLTLHRRADRRGLLDQAGGFEAPFRQGDLADALGLSRVHVNKTLRRLAAAGMVEWAEGRIALPDAPGLATLAKLDPAPAAELPLI